MLISLHLIRIINPIDDNIALLSDFDGTLARINPIPDLTSITPESKEALEQLITRRNILVGIISGRPMFDVKRRVGIDNATYSGNHGMEILFTNKTEFHYPIPPEVYANCTKLKTIISTKVKSILIHPENKKLNLQRVTLYKTNKTYNETHFTN